MASWQLVAEARWLTRAFVAVLGAGKPEADVIIGSQISPFHTTLLAFSLVESAQATLLKLSQAKPGEALGTLAQIRIVLCSGNLEDSLLNLLLKHSTKHVFVESAAPVASSKAE